MASFDFVESAAKGYNFTWEEREAFLKLATVPFIVKLISFSLIAALGLEEDLLRQGLLLAPSYFFEGVLVAQFIRMAVFDDRQAIGAPLVTAGAIVYVLTKLALSCFTGLLFMSDAAQGKTPPSEPTISTFFVATAIFALAIWSFRLLWLYVPAAMGYDLADFLKRVKSFMTSVYMIGTWLLCFIPVMLLLMIISEMLKLVFPGTETELSTLYTYGIAFFQAGLEIFIAVVSGVAMAYGVQSIYDGTNKPTPII